MKKASLVFGRWSLASARWWRDFVFWPKTNGQRPTTLFCVLGVLCGLSCALVAQTAAAPSFRITGVVVDEGGAPLDATTMGIAATTERNRPRSMTTGSDGRFTFDNLAPGKYSLFAE